MAKGFRRDNAQWQIPFAGAKKRHSSVYHPCNGESAFQNQEKNRSYYNRGRQNALAFMP